MGKKVYLTIIWIIALLVIIFSVGIRFCGWFTKHGIKSDDGDDISVTDVGSGELSDSIYVDEFSSVKLEVGFGDLKFAESGDDSYYVEYSTNDKKFVPKIGVENGVLVVAQDDMKFKDYIGTSSQKLTVIIYAPAKTEYSKVDIDSGAGDVNIENLTAKVFEIDLGAGDIRIKNSSLDSVDIDNGAGDIFMENNTFVKLDIDEGAGDITLNSIGDLNRYRFDIDCGIGDVKVGGQKVSGEYKSGNGEKEINIDIGTGNVDIIQ